MCLVAFAYNEEAHPRYRLVLAANRDESFERPTARLDFWDDHPTVLAGRDLLEGGTWMGVTRAGRVAALTNFRDPAEFNIKRRSRGLVVREFLTRPDLTPADYGRNLVDSRGDHNGYNFLFGDFSSAASELHYYSNHHDHAQKLERGVHGLSNAYLNTPWPKVEASKVGLSELLRSDEIDPSDLLELLNDQTPAPDEQLPDTGVGVDLERLLSAKRIPGDRYGTRSTSALLIERSGRVIFVEREYKPGGVQGETIRREFQIDAGA